MELKCPKLLKKFPAFYGTRRFITVFTWARHLSLSWARTIQSAAPSNLSKIHFNITLPSMPGSFKWSPSLRFPQKPRITFTFLRTCYMTCLSQSCWLYHPNDIGVQSIKLFVMQSSPLPCYLIPLGPKYPPQQPILENPQPTILPQCERPIFTTIQNNRQDYSSVYINSYTPRPQCDRKE